MLGRAIETSQNIIIVLTESFIDPVNRHGAELSEILEQHELGDVNVIVIARENLPNTDNADVRRLLARVPEPITWRDYKPEKPGIDVNRSLDADSNAQEAEVCCGGGCFRCCVRKRKQGLSSNMLYGKKLFYSKLEDRLFGRNPRNEREADDNTDAEHEQQQLIDDV